MNILPKVSILTPVFKRKKFLDLMIANINDFLYDKEKLEWFILDSWGAKGDQCDPMLNEKECIEIQKRIYPVQLKYSFLPKPMSIGEKRNYLTKNSSHNILINMDSDDYYVPDYIRYSIHTMKEKGLQMVGSPQMIFYYPEEEKFSAINCPGMRQAHEATFCYTKKHWRRMNGYSNNSQGEGTGMVDHCNEKFFGKTDVRYCMVCIVHNENTIDKQKFKKDGMFEVNQDELKHFYLIKNLKLNEQ